MYVCERGRFFYHRCRGFCVAFCCHSFWMDIFNLFRCIGSMLTRSDRIYYNMWPEAMMFFFLCICTLDSGSMLDNNWKATQRTVKFASRSVCGTRRKRGHKWASERAKLNGNEENRLCLSIKTCVKRFLRQYYNILYVIFFSHRYALLLLASFDFLHSFLASLNSIQFHHICRTHVF